MDYFVIQWTGKWIQNINLDFSKRRGTFRGKEQSEAMLDCRTWKPVEWHKTGWERISKNNLDRHSFTLNNNRSLLLQNQKRGGGFCSILRVNCILSSFAALMIISYTKSLKNSKPEMHMNKPEYNPNIFFWNIIQLWRKKRGLQKSKTDWSMWNWRHCKWGVNIFKTFLGVLFRLCKTRFVHGAIPCVWLKSINQSLNRRSMTQE